MISKDCVLSAVPERCEELLGGAALGPTDQVHLVLRSRLTLWRKPLWFLASTDQLNR